MVTVNEYFKNIYISLRTIISGMSITARHLFTPSVTLQYPRQKAQLPDKARNLLHNKIEDCIGCARCVLACPVDCIYMDVLKANKDEDLGKTSTGHNKRLWVLRFDIDMAKCCYCGLCVEPCPTECLKMTKEYEYSAPERENLIFKFSGLSAERIQNLKNTRDKPAIKKTVSEKPERQDSDD